MVNTETVTTKVTSATLTTEQMIEGFKAEMNMTDKDWHRFCLRYSTRPISTIFLFFEDIYSVIPYGFHKSLRTALIAECRGS